MPEIRTIGWLARQAGVNVETVRYYQRRGLLEEPRRPPGGIRRYREAHARRLHFIKQAQALGFTLEEVKDLLALEDGRHCREAERLASMKLAAVRARVRQLSRVEQALAILVAGCACSTGNVHCPIIAALEGDRAVAPGRRAANRTPLESRPGAGPGRVKRTMSCDGLSSRSSRSRSRRRVAGRGRD